MEACGYQLSDLEDIQFNWKDLDLNMDAVIRQDINTPVSRFPLQFSMFWKWVQ